MFSFSGGFSQDIFFKTVHLGQGNSGTIKDRRCNTRPKNVTIYNKGLENKIIKCQKIMSGKIFKEKENNSNKL